MNEGYTLHSNHEAYFSKMRSNLEYKCETSASSFRDKTFPTSPFVVVGSIILISNMY